MMANMEVGCGKVTGVVEELAILGNHVMSIALALRCSHGVNFKRNVFCCRALQKVLKPEDKAPGREALEYQIELLGKLGWGHWEKAHLSLLADSHPPLLRLF